MSAETAPATAPPIALRTPTSATTFDRVMSPPSCSQRRPVPGQPRRVPAPNEGAMGVRLHRENDSVFGNKDAIDAAAGKDSTALQLLDHAFKAHSSRASARDGVGLLQHG